MHKLKIILTGPLYVGKTTFLKCLQHWVYWESKSDKKKKQKQKLEFDNNPFLVPVSVGFEEFIICYKEKYLLKIIEIDSQPNYKSDRTSFFEIADIAILMFSLINRQLLDGLNELYEEAKYFGKKNLPIIILGSKNDEWEQKKKKDKDNWEERKKALIDKSKETQKEEKEKWEQHMKEAKDKWKNDMIKEKTYRKKKVKEERQKWEQKWKEEEDRREEMRKIDKKKVKDEIKKMLTIAPHLINCRKEKDVSKIFKKYLLEEIKKIVETVNSND
ncbi:hypothetical protein ES705_06119 [subsurface metagenome]